MNQEKLCSRCQTVKHIHEFYKKVTEKRYNSWCKSCVYDLQKLRWVDRKRKAVELMGGKCSVCGYNRTLSALEFHHIDPSLKEYSWFKLRQMKWASIVHELNKCVMVCANCHREIHSLAHGFDLECRGKDNALLNMEVLAIKPTGICPGCDNDVYGTKYCSVQCMGVGNRKVVRPDREQLKKMIAEMSYCAIGRKYSVSDNAVRKWAKIYGLLECSRNGTLS